MPGCIVPLCVQNNASRPTFCWTCDKDLIDCLQVFVSTTGILPAELAQDFISCPVPNSTFTLYWHRARTLSGMLLTGFRFTDFPDKPKFLQSVVFCSGFCLNTPERSWPCFTCDTPVQYDHPSNFFQHTGLRCMDLRDLTLLNITLNGLPWLALDATALEYLQLAGVHWFPMIVHMEKINDISLTARWSTPNYPDINIAVSH